MVCERAHGASEVPGSSRVASWGHPGPRSAPRAVWGGTLGRNSGCTAAKRYPETRGPRRDFLTEECRHGASLMSVWAGTKISKVHRLHTPSSATCPGAAPVADLANLGPRLCFAGPQRRSTAATDWPGVRPISPARRPIPMPIPTRDPMPLVSGALITRGSHQPRASGTMRRSATWQESRRARPMRADPPRGTNASRSRARARTFRLTACNRLLGGERPPWRPSPLAHRAALAAGRTAVERGATLSMNAGSEPPWRRSSMAPTATPSCSRCSPASSVRNCSQYC